MDKESNEPQQNATHMGEDFGSLFYTISRENTAVTVETVRTSNIGVTNQVTRKLHEIKMDLQSQILEAIIFAITEKVARNY